MKTIKPVHGSLAREPAEVSARYRWIWRHLHSAFILAKPGGADVLDLVGGHDAPLTTVLSTQWAWGDHGLVFAVNDSAVLPQTWADTFAQDGIGSMLTFLRLGSATTQSSDNSWCHQIDDGSAPSSHYVWTDQNWYSSTFRNDRQSVSLNGVGAIRNEWHCMAVSNDGTGGSDYRMLQSQHGRVFVVKTAAGEATVQTADRKLFADSGSGRMGSDVGGVIFLNAPMEDAMMSTLSVDFIAPFTRKTVFGAFLATAAPPVTGNPWYQYAQQRAAGGAA